MHNLQPKISKMKPEEVKKLVENYNISVSQLPKIKETDVGVPVNSQRGDVLKIERNFGENNRIYYRVVA